MVHILSIAAVIFSAAAAVQSAAVPLVPFDTLDKRSPNTDASPLVSTPSAAIVARHHYVYDGVKLVRTADPSSDPSASQLHKRYASRIRFLACNPFGQTICGTCYYHDVSYDTAVCIPTPGLSNFFVMQEMTNANAKLFKTAADCTGTSLNVAGCRTWGCNTFEGYGTKSVLAQVGCA